MLEMIQMQLDDTIIRTIETAPNKELKEARDLILRIRRRNLYQVSFCWSLLFLNSVNSLRKFTYGSLLWFDNVWWQFCNEYSVPKEKMEHFKNVTAQDIVCSQVATTSPFHFSACMCLFIAKNCLTINAVLPFSQKNGGVTLKEEDVAVSNVRIDLTRGRHNPLERYLRMLSFFGFDENVL